LREAQAERKQERAAFRAVGAFKRRALACVHALLCGDLFQGRVFLKAMVGRGSIMGKGEQCTAIFPSHY
jgi:hypothetical protein